MFLFRKVDSLIDQVVYIIESSGQNDRLWVRNTKLRDNVTIVIGYCVDVIRFCPIANQLGNVVPSLESEDFLIIYKKPHRFHMVRIDYGLP